MMTSGYVVFTMFIHGPFLPTIDWQFTLMILNGRLRLADGGLNLHGDDWCIGECLSSSESMLTSAKELADSTSVMWKGPSNSMAGEVVDWWSLLHDVHDQCTLEWPSLEYSQDGTAWQARWYQVSHNSHMTDSASQSTCCLQVPQRYTVEAWLRSSSGWVSSAILDLVQLIFSGQLQLSWVVSVVGSGWLLAGEVTCLMCLKAVC